MLFTAVQTFVLAALVARASAQLDDHAPDQCVDPAGYTKCNGAANAAYITCSSKCPIGSDSCVPGCERALKGTFLTCWIQSCWNQLPSCYYQDQVVLYLTDPLIAGTSPPPTIPFWPLPDGLGGACQCNLGEMYQLWSLANSTQGQDPCPAGSDCACCFQSALLAKYYDLCPTGNYDFAGGLAAQLNATNALLQSSNDCGILRSPSDPNKACAVFGSAPFGAKEYLDPVSLPSGFPGTTLTDGPGSVTALAVSGSTTVLSLPNLTTTITFASYTGVSGATGPTGGNPTLSPAAVSTIAVGTFNPSASGSASSGGSSGGASSGATGGGATGGSTTAAAGVTSSGSAGTSAAQSAASNSGSAAAPSSTKSAASSRSVGGKFWWALGAGVLFLI